MARDESRGTGEPQAVLRHQGRTDSPREHCVQRTATRRSTQHEKRADGSRPFVTHRNRGMPATSPRQHLLATHEWAAERQDFQVRRLLGAPPVATEGTTSATRLHRTSVVQSGRWLMRHRQQRVDRRLRLLQQLHRGVTTYQSNVVECHPCAEEDFRPIRRSRHVTDNGTQFASAEFAVFARTWSFDHVTSSPRHPQSNGKAENAVKTVKQLFTKCRQSGQSEFQALLDWRNTPTEGMQTSPAQRLIGRRCKTLLPIAGQLLQPRHSTEQDAQDVLGRKERQAFFYNKKTKPLEPIAPGETIRLRLPGQQTWSAGTCLRTSGPRSYKVEVVYRRNRRQLIRTSVPETERTSYTGTGAGEQPGESTDSASASQSASSRADAASGSNEVAGWSAAPFRKSPETASLDEGL